MLRTEDASRPVRAAWLLLASLRPKTKMRRRSRRSSQHTAASTLAWLLTVVLVTLLPSCSAGLNADDDVLVEGVVISESAQALTVGSLQWLDGTYGAGCISRPGAWSLRLGGVAAMTNAPLSVVRNNSACTLTVTALVASAQTSTATPSITLTTSYAAAPSSFALTSSVGFFGNAKLSGTTFASDVVLTLLFSDDARVGGAGVGATYETHTLGGTVSGLTGAGLNLQNNGGDTTSISSNGAFTLATPVVRGATYNVTVSQQASTSTCWATQGSGTMGSANVTNVAITCAPNPNAPQIALAGYAPVSVFAGRPPSLNGVGAAASIDAPVGVAINGAGDVVTVGADHRLRVINASGRVTLLAGSGMPLPQDGTGVMAGFNAPSGLNTDSSGNYFVADTAGHRIRKVTTAGVVTTFAGYAVAGAVNATGASASFNMPMAIALDSSSNVYVADMNNHRIRKITTGGVVTTFAGSTAGYANATGVSAKFNAPSGLAVDSSGNVFVADTVNSCIRKVTSAGVVTAFAGTCLKAGYVDATGTSARFRSPRGLTVDGSNNLYVADSGNHRIRKITSAGVVTTLAGSSAGFSDGTGSAAQFMAPEGVAVNSSGTVHVADTGNSRIRSVTSAGVVTTLAGSRTNVFADGSGSAATFNAPEGIVEDGAGNVYVGDLANNRIRHVTSVGVVSTLAGSSSRGSTNGNGSGAAFDAPAGVAKDASGNIYVADSANHLIRKVTPAGVVTTLAGSGSPGSTDATGASASFDVPIGVAVDSAGIVYVADSNNDRIRKIATDGTVSTLAGSTCGMANGTGTAATFASPRGVAVDASGNVYVADTGNHLIRKITSAGVVTTMAGSAGVAGFKNNTGTGAMFKNPTGIAVDASGNVYVADTGNHRIRKITSANVVTGVAGGSTAGFVDSYKYATRMRFPRAIAVSSSGTLYVADTGNNRIRKIPPATTAEVTTMAGSGESYVNATGTAAMFDAPAGVAVDGSGNVYIADTGNHRIRKITSAGVVTLLAGSGAPSFTDGAGAAAAFNGPRGLAVDSSGDIYVSDTENNRIRKITSAGVVTTLAGSGAAGATNGTGTGATFSSPRGVSVDSSGNVYVADTGNHLIRKVTSNGVVTTLAGSSGVAGWTDATGTSAKFASPEGVFVDGSGNVFVADTYNGVVRKITSAGVVTTPLGCDSFNSTIGVALDASGNILVLDSLNRVVYKVFPDGAYVAIAGSYYPAFGDGSDFQASFDHPQALALDSLGAIYVADTGNNSVRRIVDLASGQAAVGWFPAYDLDGTTPIQTYTATLTATALSPISCGVTDGTLTCIVTGLAVGASYVATVRATGAAGGISAASSAISFIAR